MATRFYFPLSHIDEVLASPAVQRELTGIRGLKNHIASWSDRAIDRQAFFDDPGVRLGFEYEAKSLQATLKEAREEVSPAALVKLRTRTFCSRCDLLLSLADELSADLAELLSPLRIFTSVEKFAVKAANHDWEMISRELEGELEWLGTDELASWLSTVRAFAIEQLTGKARRAVEIVCDAGGRCTFADIATDNEMDWRVFSVPNGFKTSRDSRNGVLKRAKGLKEIGAKLEFRDAKNVVITRLDTPKIQQPVSRLSPKRKTATRPKATQTRHKATRSAR